MTLIQLEQRLSSFALTSYCLNFVTVGAAPFKVRKIADSDVGAVCDRAMKRIERSCAVIDRAYIGGFPNRSFTAFLAPCGPALYCWDNRHEQAKFHNRHISYPCGSSDCRSIGNLWFDVSSVVSTGTTVAQATLIATRLRELGVQRILYGTDGLGINSARDGWNEFLKLPLTIAEFRTIANNTPPFMS